MSGYRDVLAGTKGKKDSGVWFKVQDHRTYEGVSYLNTKEMVKYAKDMLRFNKRVHGLDKDVKVSDLNQPINAWVYLKNIGLGFDTNHSRFW